jgi:hypothetical protein
VTLAAGGCLGGGGDGKSGRKVAQNGNRAPQISGTSPPETLADEFYDFRPAASDPDGDRLVFSISNQPAWTQFDPETGRLSGTPAARDIGIYTGIVIVASDGRQSAALPAFELAVTDSASGMVTLSWLPPTQNADGSPLHDLAGYRIYVGQNPDELSRVIVLNNPGLARHVVDGLTPATWHFAMTSFNRKGQESRRSATVSKLVG